MHSVWNLAKWLAETWLFKMATAGFIFALAVALTGEGNRWFSNLDPEDRVSLVRAGGFVLAVLAGTGTAVAFFKLLTGLQSESRNYARNISGRADSELAAEVHFGPIRVGDRRQPQPEQPPVAEVTQQPAETSASLPALDISSPDKVFQIARQRLLDEAVRLDGISTRNLAFGIIFSGIALTVLAWPLVSQAFITDQTTPDVFSWAARYYAPRFAVGLLLQFVGFFFLRLYVANENDLKHNKNELTNLEMKMIGLQLAQQFSDASSKKEIIKSFAQTERNFILKKNERSSSYEASDYNDLKGLLDKLVDKIPGAGKK